MRSSRFTWGNSQQAPLQRNNWRTSGLFGPGDRGDTMEDAKDVGNLKRSKNYKYSGDVGGDDLDYYRVKLKEKSDFSIRLEADNDNGEPIALSILNEKGKVIRRNKKLLFANVNPDDSQTISVDGLGKGVYFFRLQSAKGDNEDYKIRFSLNSSSGSDDDNGDGNSRKLGNLDRGRSYNFDDKVGGSDVDFYSFDLDRTSRVSAFLSNQASISGGSNNSIALSILDSQKRTVQTTSGRFLFDNVEPAQSTTLFAPLPEGSYSVRVQSDVGRDLPYKLRLTRSTTDVTSI